MGTSKRLSVEVLAILSALDIQGPNVRILTRLDRKLYAAVNEALEAIGGKWSRKEKAHVFDQDPRARIDLAIDCGEVERPKDYDFFATPAELADRLVELAGVQEGDHVLEPSAGQGAIVDAVLLATKTGGVTAFEHMEANYDSLRKRYANDPRVALVWGDFAALPTLPRCDRVCMNPPFSKRQDIAHVTRAFEWLRPGGRLAAIMSAGVLFREDKLARTFREFVREHQGTIEPLPEGSFKASGTMVNTVIVGMTKESS